ncbi:MAG: hypothetical protein CVU51_07730 [Deltaproteobacteria bacterium HGW-Deltaproteobacteria-1]|nr:MAG: hypothetical protein CVU51_07730 [Deltaproteobacteria bacterium HGW-Deltaproteobacteria-1]
MTHRQGTRTMQINTAFILGAGLGTRLRPLTENMPKPLLPIGGRPIITYAMEHLRIEGIRRFIVNTHHCAEKYTEAFPEGSWQGIPITFRHEPVLLDTAGGIKNIEDLIAQDERILVYNGDIITNLPLAPLIDRHFELQTQVTLALRSSGPLLNVNIDSGGFICDMRHTLNHPGILGRLSPGHVESIVGPLLSMIQENPQSVGGVLLNEGYWYDVGSLAEFERLTQRGL